MAKKAKKTEQTAGFDIYELFATDEKLEINGVDIDLGGGAMMTVARAGNDNYIRRLIEELQKHEKELAEDTPEAQALDTKILIEVMAETLLLNFSGFMYKGEPLPYSRENAVKALQHKGFRRRVQFEASNINNYRRASEEADEKN